MTYQFTVYDPSKHYMPISTHITPKEHEKFSSLKERAITNICASRYLSREELIKLGYTKLRYRKIK